jgi:hypothetical protein
MSYFRLAAAVVIAVLPALAHAQLPARVNRGGGFSFELTNGEPVSFYLEHSRELELTEAQKQSMIEIRRRLRATNAPFTRQLDSLRELLGISLEPGLRVRDTEAEKIERFQQLSRPIADSMRVNNDAARNEVWAILLEPQRTKVDSIAKFEKENAGRRGGPGGRRPASERASAPPPA